MAVGGVAQAVAGMGFALVAAPVLIASLGHEEGVSTVVTLGTLVALLALMPDWRHAKLGEVGRLGVPMLIVTPLAALALAGVDPDALALGAGVAVLAGVAMLAAGASWAWLTRPYGAVATGASSAVLNVLGGVGGPPVGIYAANARWPPRTMRGTLQTWFLVQNGVTAIVLGPAVPSLALIAALVAGTGAGMLLTGHLPEGATRAGVLALSAAGGVALIAGAL